MTVTIHTNNQVYQTSTTRQLADLNTMSYDDMTLGPINIALKSLSEENLSEVVTFGILMLLL